jgi:GTP-binding protein
MLAITKSDMLDEELMNELRKELPEELDTIFISSVSGYNIMQLKDMLWQKING